MDAACFEGASTIIHVMVRLVLTARLWVAIYQWSLTLSLERTDQMIISFTSLAHRVPTLRASIARIGGAYSVRIYRDGVCVAAHHVADHAEAISLARAVRP